MCAKDAPILHFLNINTKHEFYFVKKIINSLAILASFNTSSDVRLENGYYTNPRNVVDIAYIHMALRRNVTMRSECFYKNKKKCYVLSHRVKIHIHLYMVKKHSTATLYFGERERERHFSFPIPHKEHGAVATRLFVPRNFMQSQLDQKSRSNFLNLLTPI
jgi:hypothetical protein